MLRPVEVGFGNEGEKVYHISMIHIMRPPYLVAAPTAPGPTVASVQPPPIECVHVSSSEFFPDSFRAKPEFDMFAR